MATTGEQAIQAEEGASEEWLEQADRAAPMGRILRPIDVARLVTFLLSDDGEMMTRSIIDFNTNVIVGAFD